MEAVLLSAVTRVVNSIKLVGLAAGKEEDRDDGDDAVDLIEAMDVVFSKQYPVDCLSVKKQACECGVQSLCDSHEDNCDSMLTCEDCAVWKRRHRSAAEGFMMDGLLRNANPIGKVASLLPYSFPPEKIRIHRQNLPLAACYNTSSWSGWPSHHSIPVPKVFVNSCVEFLPIKS